MQKFMRKKGLTAFSIDDAPKWAKDYFFALEKESLPYWNMDKKNKGIRTRILACIDI